VQPLSRLRFCSLGSGSSGNASLVESTTDRGVSRVLLDCGMPLKHLEERLALRKLRLKDVDAVFVTHEHSDHIGCARQLAVQSRIPIWMSRGTYHAIGRPDLHGQLRFASDQTPISIGSLRLHPFTVAHDAKEPLQLRVTSGEKSLGLLTDLGHVTPHTLAQLQQLDAIILECNHDATLLSQSRYPPFLKERIMGRFGHLSNQQAAAVLAQIRHPHLMYVVAAHLSEQNNTPELVRLELTTVLPDRCSSVVIADAVLGFDWLQL
jgi:phosphoribosyl 1,2-cyclic phosphodiesterase